MSDVPVLGAAEGSASPEKHTPGPWRVLPQHSRTRLLSIFTPHGWCARIFGTTDESDANARLIAAAPELLKALKASRDVLISCAMDTEGTPSGEFFKSKVRHCDIVIAKATLAAHPETTELSSQDQPK